MFYNRFPFSIGFKYSVIFRMLLFSEHYMSAYVLAISVAKYGTFIAHFYDLLCAIIDLKYNDEIN